MSRKFWFKTDKMRGGRKEVECRTDEGARWSVGQMKGRGGV